MGDEADHDYALEDAEVGYEAADRHYGVFAPSWVTDEGFIEVLKAEAADAASDRDRALFLTAVDRIADSERHLAAALRSIADQELMRVEISDLQHKLEIEEGVSQMLATDRDDALDETEELRAELAAKDALVAELRHWIGASM